MVAGGLLQALGDSIRFQQDFRGSGDECPASLYARQNIGPESGEPGFRQREKVGRRLR